MPSVILKPGREKSLLRRHPWIFSGAVQHADNEIDSGASVDVLSSKGDFLGRGAYSQLSQIRVRIWTFEEQTVDADFFRRRIRAALDIRNSIFDPQATNAMRLIYAESDGIPGLIVDRYNDTLVLQSLTAGSEYWK